MPDEPTICECGLFELREAEQLCWHCVVELEDFEAETHPERTLT